MNMKNIMRMEGHPMNLYAPQSKKRNNIQSFVDDELSDDICGQHRISDDVSELLCHFQRVYQGHLTTSL